MTSNGPGVRPWGIDRSDRQGRSKNESAAAAERAAGAVELTGRQREVVGLLALGLTAQEIGTELGISARTARAHTDVIRRKLGAARSRQIPRTYWRRTGINPLELRTPS